MFVNITSFECRGKQLVKQIKKFSSAWTFYIHMYVSHSMQLDSHSWTSNVGQQRYARWKFFFFLKSWNINMSVVYFTLHLDSHCRPQNELSSDRPPLSVLIVKYRAPDTAFLLVPIYEWRRCPVSCVVSQSQNLPNHQPTNGRQNQQITYLRENVWLTVWWIIRSYCFI